MDDNRKIGDELFGNMVDKLRNHAEPYQEGAWERFVTRNPDLMYGGATQEGTPTRVGGTSRIGQGWRSPWKWGVAAAVLLLVGISIFWWGELGREESGGAGESLLTVENVETVETGETLTTGLSELSLSAPPVTSSNSGATDPIAEVVHTKVDHTKPAHQTASTTSETVTTAWQSRQLEPAPTLTLTAIDLQLASLEVAGHDQQMPGSLGLSSFPSEISDPYAWLEETPATAMIARGGDLRSGEKSNMDKWDIGLVLSSAMTTEQLNLGGGVSLAYRLSDRLSLRSGLAVGKYGVNSQGAGPGNRPESAFDTPVHPSKQLAADAKPEHYTRQLSATTSSLLTMDIPIDLKYSWTNQFYTSVGMSFLGVLNEDRTYHFIDRINEPVFAGEGSAGNDIAYSVRAFHVEERATEHPLHGKGYAGFLNFSVGHRTPLSKKINLSIEPFFKLPIGRLSDEDMNLTNGGIRIVTGF